MPKPFVGATVHRRSSSGCIAAIVTRVHADGSVDLTVFPPSAEIRTHVRLPEGEQDGAWHWPEDAPPALYFNPDVTFTQEELARFESELNGAYQRATARPRGDHR